MIAYYAHSHGYGHCNSGEQFYLNFPSKTLVMTASKYKFQSAVKYIRLPSEDTEFKDYLSTTYNLPRYAHYLPKSHVNLLKRNTKILQNCVSHNIKFAIVDVSVETAIQFRIAGIPYAYHKMLGDRFDEPHKMVFDASEFLFARYPKQLEGNKNDHFLDKTYHLGFLSRFSYQDNCDSFKYKPIDKTSILILAGKGGTGLSQAVISHLVNQLPNTEFTVIGIDIPRNKSLNLKVLPFEKDLQYSILSHDIVISSCGLNLTSEILALKNKFIAVPEVRPYNEQEVLCNKLEENELAVKLNSDNLMETIERYHSLKKIKDLHSYFGSMANFKNINYVKEYL